MRVYLAARFSRFDELNRYREELTDVGIAVTSRWLDGGHEWVGTPDDEIPVDELPQVRFFPDWADAKAELIRIAPFLDARAAELQEARIP